MRYVAAKRLSWDPSRSGGGTLGPSTDALRLTKQGSSPSVWDLPMAFAPSWIGYRDCPLRTFDAGQSTSALWRAGCGVG